jgi:hypothetical protein
LLRILFGQIYGAAIYLGRCDSFVLAEQDCTTRRRGRSGLGKSCSVIPGKTSRPIYMHKGDGRLTTHNRHINLLHFFAFTIFSLTFASCSSLSSTSLQQRTQGPRGGHADLGQPIATVLSDGFPPGSVRCRVSKALTNVSCVSRSRRDSPYDMSRVSARYLSVLQHGVWFDGLTYPQ